MPLVYVTRKVHFNAAHRLHTNNLSEQENENLYGQCNNLYGHGHNYELEVTVRGEPDPVTGMVIDLKELKDILQERVVKVMDHKHLNHDVEIMRGIVPTAENIAIVIWQQLADHIPIGTLYEVKLYETPRNMVIYRGE